MQWGVRGRTARGIAHSGPGGSGRPGGDRQPDVTAGQGVASAGPGVGGAGNDRPAPEGSKGVPLPAAGTLLVRLTASVPIPTAVVRTLQSWLIRRPGRSLELTLDGDLLKVTAISADEQRRLIDAWIARHTER